MYDKTVTIVNKLKKADLPLATTDTWIKTIINSAEYKKNVVKNVSGQTVSMGESITILIPFNQGYLPYQTWKTDTSQGFTMSVGDLIFLDMELSETVTSSNVTLLKNTYDCCEVRSINTADPNEIVISFVQLQIVGV